MEVESEPDHYHTRHTLYITLLQLLHQAPPDAVIDNAAYPKGGNDTSQSGDTADEPYSPHDLPSFYHCRCAVSVVKV